MATFRRVSKLKNDGTFKVNYVVSVPADSLSEFTTELELDGHGNPKNEKTKELLERFASEFAEFTASVDEAEQDLDDLEEVTQEEKDELAAVGITSIKQLATLEGPLAEKYSGLTGEAKAFIRNSDLFKRQKARIDKLKKRIENLKARVDDLQTKRDEFKAERDALQAQLDALQPTPEPTPDPAP